MPTDPRLGIPYPANTDANDVPRDIKAVVDKIGPIMAVDLQGTLSARPAAGVRGRFYTVAGDAAANNGRWFRDNGTVWVELPALGATATWTPTVQAASGIVPTKVSNSDNFAEYVLIGNLCHVEYKQLTSFAGTASYDYRVSLPIAPIKETQGAGICQNDGGFVYAIPAWTGVSMRHARVYGGLGDLVGPGGGTYEMFTITYRFR
jgi:hypothetical protein